MKPNFVVRIAILIVLSSVLLTACGVGATAQPTNTPQVVRIVTEAAYPPFETVDETTKELVGFDMDLIRAVMDTTGLEYEIINIAWDPLLTGMAQCQYDAAISAITITEERQQAMGFSNGYINAGQIVTVNTATTDISGPEDLVGRRIAVQLGTTGDIEAQKIEGAEVKAYDSVDLAFQDLKNKQVDAVVADYPTSLAFVEANAGDIVTVGEPFTEEVYGIAVCKTDTALLEMINAGLKTVSDKGLIQELEQKWLAGQ
jgi:polar amino acid transport system substrate-binding protein